MGRWRFRRETSENAADALLTDAAELDRRRADWHAPPLKATRGTLAKYARLVKTASEGCVTDE